MISPIVDLRKKPQESPIPEHTASENTQTPPAADTSPPAPAPKNTAALTWSVLEFQEKEKNERVWVRRTLTAAIPLAVILLFLKNFLGAVVVLLSAFAFLLAAFRKPRMLQCAITDKGVRVDEKLTPFRSLTSFWIFTEPETERMLSIRQKSTFQQNITIPLRTVDPEEVKRALLPYIPEEEQQPSAVDQIMRQIGF